jgi:hypothetical protein
LLVVKALPQPSSGDATRMARLAATSTRASVESRHHKTVREILSKIFVVRENAVRLPAWKQTMALGPT